MAIRKLNFKFHNLKLHVWLTFLLGIAGLEDGWNGFEKKDEMITARPSKRLSDSGERRESAGLLAVRVERT